MEKQHLQNLDTIHPDSAASKGSEDYKTPEEARTEFGGQIRAEQTSLNTEISKTKGSLRPGEEVYLNLFNALIEDGAKHTTAAMEELKRIAQD